MVVGGGGGGRLGTSPGLILGAICLGRCTAVMLIGDECFVLLLHSGTALL